MAPQRLTPAAIEKRVVSQEQRCRRAVRTQRATTFRRSDQGLRALLGANPQLAELLQTDCSNDCKAYRGWRRNGRRGPKEPPRSSGEGRFDALDIALERRGKRRITSWLEALYAAVPPSRRWREFRDRAPPLAEATGEDVLLPDPAYRLEDDARAFEACHAEAEELARSLRHGRREKRRTLEDAPL